jgi:hypothetical protein
MPDNWEDPIRWRRTVDNTTLAETYGSSDRPWTNGCPSDVCVKAIVSIQEKKEDATAVWEDWSREKKLSGEEISIFAFTIHFLLVSP